MKHDKEELVNDTSQNREDISTNDETGSESEIDETRRDYWVWEKGDITLLNRADFESGQEAAGRQAEEGSTDEPVERHLGGHIGQEGLPGGGSQPGYTHAGVATVEDDGDGHVVGEVYSVDANYFGTEEDILVELLKWDPDTEVWTIEIISGSSRENTGEVGSYELNEPDEADLATWTEPGGEALADRAISVFGLTDDYREAGFILENGEMIDLSGKREGGTAGTRIFDHREVGRAAFIDADFEQLPEERSGNRGLIYFMNETGAVRMSYFGDSAAIDLATNPTRAQREVIEVIGFLGGGIDALDISDEQGHLQWSGSIDDPEDISNEINRLAFEYLRNRAFITMVFRHEVQKRVVVGPLRRVVICHGKHIDRAGEEEEDGDNVAA